MPPTNAVEENKDTPKEAENGEEESKELGNSLTREIEDYDPVIDISGKSLDFPVLGETGGVSESIEGLYVYKNVFSFIPKSIVGLTGLRTLKFFANEINLVPQEFKNLIDLECLQFKVSLPSLNGLNLHKLKSLKELELSNVPARPSAFPILREIAALKCLKKLSVCHFSIRYLPPEIGCLNKLEYLDLSFNKLRGLPIEITCLGTLISLKITNNKLIDLPSGLSSLQRLENFDLSNNRLTSLGCLELDQMHNLRRLNLQYNNLCGGCQIPAWICCNLDGNNKDVSNDKFINSSVEMDVFEGSVPEICDSFQNSSSLLSSIHLTEPPSNSRCFTSRKGWKGRYYLQQRARQEHLNSNMKLKGENYTEQPTQKEAEKCKRCKHVVHASNSLIDCSSNAVHHGIDKHESLSRKDCENSSIVEDDYIGSEKGDYVERHPCALDSVEVCKEVENDSAEVGSNLECLSSAADVHDEGSSSESDVHKCNLKSKRHPDRDLDNPKPSKALRPIRDYSDLSCKFSNISFCSSEDYLQDGFYDAGRDRPFLPLRSYEQKLHLNSREVILVDRERDENLDASLLCAQALVYRFKQVNHSTKDRGQVHFDDLQIASLLALFVSDHFGGSDKNAVIERARKAVSGSNYRKPFVCTCPMGNSDDVGKFSKHNLDAAEDIVFLGLCEKALQSVKERRSSIVVPIGTVQFGVCRHRALLMKYLCDRMEPRIRCELVRGYLDFSPHAWNVLIVKRGDSWVRMVVDACRPYDIREEADPEYFCRYIPLRRINLCPVTDTNCCPIGSFPSTSTCDEIVKAGFTSLVRCQLGSNEAVAKVRTLDVCGASTEEIRNFEFNCLGEVRILSALKHSCIVEIYGHQISSSWDQLDGNPAHRTIQYSILMEYIKGGSLKNYIEKLSRAGKKHVPVDLVLSIATDVASALAELHSKHIIHRDVKSENILIDLDKGVDASPVVKLCDFDRAIPLRSYLHTCCIAHMGIPSSDICVGTPHWMAPEVFKAMHKRSIYGLEVDIWSFGCLLLELLTLQVPYSGLPEAEIHDLLQMGKRPRLTDELEALAQPDVRLVDFSSAQSTTEMPPQDTESESLGFLVDVYRQCTKENPNERPTSHNLYNLLVAHTSSVRGSRNLEG